MLNMADYDNQKMLSEVQLPCGRRLHNRFVKAPLYEHLAPLNGGPPNDLHYALYARWAAGEWGMVITGNVQVSPRHMGLGRDVAAPTTINELTLAPFKKYAAAIHGERSTSDDFRRRPLAVMQICHTGRQSMNFIGGRPPFVSPLAPSAVPMELKAKRGRAVPLLGHIARGLLFRTALAMTPNQVDEAVGEFVKTAVLAAKAGFDGVQLHAAHGYLISQFMSQKSNVRTDEYSAKKNPLLFLHRIVSAIRGAGEIPQDFVVGVKMNAADYVDSGAGVVASEDFALDHLKEIASWGLVDFIEVSGGDYDSPDFITDINPSARQAVFEGFSKRAMESLESSDLDLAKRPLIMLTGGLRSPQLMASAMERGHADLLGIGRYAILQPELPKIIRENPTVDIGTVFPFFEDSSRKQLPMVPWLEYIVSSTIIFLWNSIPDAVRPQIPGLIGAGTETAKYDTMMRALAKGQEKLFYTGESLGILWRFWYYRAPGPRSGLIGYCAVLLLGVCTVVLAARF